MRRPLGVVALGLLLLGIEAATGAVSLAVARYFTGIRAVLAGDEFVVSAPRFVGGVVLTFLGAVLTGALVWSERVRRQVTAMGEICPNCGTETRRVRRSAWHRALSRFLDDRVTHRKCKRCGWSGLAA